MLEDNLRIAWTYIRLAGEALVYRSRTVDIGGPRP